MQPYFCQNIEVLIRILCMFLEVKEICIDICEDMLKTYFSYPHCQRETHDQHIHKQIQPFLVLFYLSIPTQQHQLIAIKTTFYRLFHQWDLNPINPSLILPPILLQVVLKAHPLKSMLKLCLLIIEQLILQLRYLIRIILVNVNRKKITYPAVIKIILETQLRIPGQVVWRRDLFPPLLVAFLHLQDHQLILLLHQDHLDLYTWFLVFFIPLYQKEKYSLNHLASP